MNKKMTEARFYLPEGPRQLRCKLCPHECLLDDGERGLCRVRRHEKGMLVAASYGRVMGLHLDPIEKKPLHRFFPGSLILSVGSHGCNFCCPWCQNAHISQRGVEGLPEPCRPHEIVDAALASRKRGNIGVAYTYNEPTMFYEFMLDTARGVEEAGMKNAMVTNGYIQQEPLRELLKVMHAFNVDLKAFSDPFYRKYCGGSLQPVLDSLKAISDQGRHLEITFLVITGLNDELTSFQEMLQWIGRELDTGVVLHINRYYPSWQWDAPPTPRDLLERMAMMARDQLAHVRLGNLP